MPNSRLTLKRINFRYPNNDWSLKNLELDVSPTDFQALIGPNGSGKSTLLKIAAGILSPSTGSVLLGGEALRDKDRNEIAKVIGYLPQYSNVDNGNTAEEVVALGRYPYTRNIGLLRRSDALVVDHCMRVTETETLRNRPLDSLSGGERQRVLLGSVLAQEPEILLLDEPTSGLDIPHQAKFYKLLSKLAADGFAIVVATHNINLAALYCTSALLIRAGEVVDRGSIPEMITEQKLAGTFGSGIVVRHLEAEANRPIVLPG